MNKNVVNKLAFPSNNFGGGCKKVHLNKLFFSELFPVGLLTRVTGKKAKVCVDAVFFGVSLESRGPGVDPFRAGGPKWIYTRSTGFQVFRDFWVGFGAGPLNVGYKLARAG